MFKRMVEDHQGVIFSEIESVQDYAAKTDKSMFRYRAFLNRIEALGCKGKMLDVGAGTGNLAVEIVNHIPGIEITALEISEEMAAFGERTIREQGLDDRIHYQHGDAEDSEAAKDLGEFDLVYSTFSLHHWVSPQIVIRNLMNNLSDNGILYLYDLRRVWWLYWIPKKNGFLNSIRASYVRGELKKMFEDISIDQFDIIDEFPFMQSIIIRKYT